MTIAFPLDAVIANHIGHECEVRFHPPVGVFYRIKNALVGNALPTITTDKIMGEHRTSVGSDGRTTIMIKTVKYRHKVEPFEYNVVISSEQPTLNVGPPGDVTVRQKTRWSHDWEGVRVDMTEVRMPSKVTVRGDIPPTWEIELELMPVGTPQQLETATERMLHLIQNSPILYTVATRNTVINEWNEAMRILKPKDIPAHFGGGLDHTTMVKLRNLKRRDLTQKGIGTGGYTITTKCNGVNRCLYIHRTGVWLIYPPFEMMLIIAANDAFAPHYGTCLAGELVVVEEKALLYVPFDMLIINNDPHIQQRPHSERLAGCARFATILGGFGDIITLFNKDFLPVGTTPEQFATAYRQIRDTTYPFATDGMVVTPEYAPYNPHSDVHDLDKRVLSAYPDVCKVKPWHELTIDFRVVTDPVSGTGRVMVNKGKSGQAMTSVVFEGSRRYPFHSATDIDWTHPMLTGISGGAIVEFGPEDRRPDGGIILIPRQLRPDKPSPNTLQIATDVWADILNPLKEATLLGEDFERLYQQNNVLKRTIFGTLDGRTILVDIGSGRGGDVSKWTHLQHVVCVEPNPEHVVELRRRIALNGMTDRTTVLPVGAEDTQTIVTALKQIVGATGVIKSKSGPVKDVIIAVSAMLSLSFFWRDLDLLKGLVKTLRGIARCTAFKVPFHYFTSDGPATLRMFQTYGDWVTIGPCTMQYIPFMSGCGLPGTVEINLPESIVGEQTEYLVNLLDLSPSQGDASLPSTVETYLTADERMFASLFVHGSFGISKNVDVRKSLPEEMAARIPVDITRYAGGIPVGTAQSGSRLFEAEGNDTLVPIPDTDFARIGTLGDDAHPGDSFLHAVFNAVSTTYQTGGMERRLEMVRAFRRDLATLLATAYAIDEADVLAIYGGVDPRVNFIGVTAALPLNTYFYVLGNGMFPRIFAEIPGQDAMVMVQEALRGPDDVPKMYYDFLPEFFTMTISFFTSNADGTLAGLDPITVPSAAAQICIYVTAEGHYETMGRVDDQLITTVFPIAPA